MLTPDSPNLNQASVGCAGQAILNRGGSVLQFTGLKGYAANVLVPDTTANLKRSCGPLYVLNQYMALML